jgi:DNA/RNA-binding protein KIN17
MNATKWNSLTEFVKHLSREGIVNFKEDEKDGLMIAWRDTSMAATKRREEVRALEDAEAKNGAGEDKMLKRMAQRAKQEAEAKAKAAEARKAAESEIAAQKTSESPPTETPPATAKGEDANKPQSEALPAEAAPVKISFGLKAKAAGSNKAGLGQMKSQSVFKRMRTGGEEKPVKKVKL